MVATLPTVTTKELQPTAMTAVLLNDICIDAAPIRYPLHSKPVFTAALQRKVHFSAAKLEASHSRILIAQEPSMRLS